MAGIIAFLLFVVAFIVRAVHGGGLEAEDYVLWMLAGLAAMAFAPAYVFVQSRRERSTA